MEVIKNIQPSQWEALTLRPTIDTSSLANKVQEMLDNVIKDKDNALKKYSISLDKVNLNNFLVSSNEIDKAESLVPDELKVAIHLAKSNIEKFHKSQQISEEVIETCKGVQCWRKSVAIEKVGFYVPGGTAPLFSTVLMLGIPAQIAGCKQMVMCTPPDIHGNVHPAILYATREVGIEKIFKIGGAQAIAAMAFGTESVPAVYKIFGPGNQYVTKAKELVQQYGIAIDMPAGPSEVLVIADHTGIPEFIAADLLSQAEHGTDSQVILLSNSEKIIHKTMHALDEQLEKLPRKEIARRALQKSKAILLNSMEECLEWSNLYAPEHLVIASENATMYADSIVNAGSVFLGNYSCESAGDYASGTNHTLPTHGFAKNYSGVSLDSFVKKITFQYLNKEGIATIGDAVEFMAEVEGLHAHKNAMALRRRPQTLDLRPQNLDPTI